MGYKTTKYVMDFETSTQRSQFKSAAATLGISINELLLHSIKQTLIEYSKGKLTKKNFQQKHELLMEA